MNTVLDNRCPQDLRPHPLNDEIYGDRADSDLVESIRQKGIFNPLLITQQNYIISGHRRWAAALAVGLTSIPVVLFGSDDELDIQEALIESNRQRTKTNEQVGREYDHLKRIYNERESRQGERPQPQKTEQDNIDTSVRIRTEVAKSEPAKATAPSVKAAEAIGVAKDTANKAASVVYVIDDLKSVGQTEQAEELRKKLNHSVNGAYTEAKASGLIEPVAAKTEPKKPQHFTLTAAQWQNADAKQRADWLFTQHESGSTFNQTNDNIEWAAWSWNPVTGCLHNCAYCYARDIANRFFSYLPDGERFSPVFYPDRLCAPDKTKSPDLSQITDPIERMAKRNVFVCSMADLFGKWVPTEWINAVLQQAWDNPQWTFLFLTKFPIRMAEFEYPQNTWIGTTVDSQYAVERAEKAFRKVREGGYEGVAWLSCEPMMERLTFTEIDMFDWVVVGGSSKSTQTPEFKPPLEWTIHLWNQAKLHNLPIYMKTNLGIENGTRVKEYPGI